jgi:hypothetical protein
METFQGRISVLRLSEELSPAGFSAAGRSSTDPATADKAEEKKRV